MVQFQQAPIAYLTPFALLVSVSTASTRHTYMMLMSAFYGNHNWIFRRRKKIHEYLFRNILYLSDRWLFSRHKIIQSKSITYINQNELNAGPNVTIVIVRDFLYWTSKMFRIQRIQMPGMAFFFFIKIIDTIHRLTLSLPLYTCVSVIRSRRKYNL